MCVCTYVYTYVCIFVYMCVCMFVLCVYVCTYLRMCVCMFVCNIYPDLFYIQGFDLFCIQRISINSIQFNSNVHICRLAKHAVRYL